MYFTLRNFFYSLTFNGHQLDPTTNAFFQLRYSVHLRYSKSYIGRIKIRQCQISYYRSNDHFIMNGLFLRYLLSANSIK